MSQHYSERFQLIEELKDYLNGKYCEGDQSTMSPQKLAVDFKNYLQQFLAGNLNLILEGDQS